MISIDLAQERVLVMGGGGSIGSAIATACVSAGASVAIADADAGKVERLSASMREGGHGVFAIPVDLSDSASVEVCVASAAERMGGVTALVNAAGLWRTARSEDMTDEMWSSMFEVNLGGVFRASRAVVPHLKAAGRGAIVNIASVAAFVGSADSAPYSATKAGVIGYTTGLAGELAPSGVRVNSICPGWVDGGFTHQALAASTDPDSLRAVAHGQHLLGRMATPEDVANAAVWLLSDLAGFVTGTSLFVDGGFMIKR